MTTPYWERSLSQRTYPGVGDIDDCWVVATIWAIRRATHQSANLPNCKVYRAAAGDPDDGRSDGGTVKEITQANNRLYPHIADVTFQKQNGWTAFVGYLNRGYTASLAVRSSYLPATLRYGFYGTHQIAVFKRAGKFYVMNPLQPKGTAPRVISEAALKRATYKFANSWVMADLIPPINLGKIVIKAQAIRYWTRTASGKWTSALRTTRGFSAVCTPPRVYTVNGKQKKMVFLSTSTRAGKWVELNSKRTFTP
jgi:hypothetical protein